LAPTVLALGFPDFTGFDFGAAFFRTTDFLGADFFAFAGAFFFATVLLAAVLAETLFFFADCFRAGLGGLLALLFFAAVDFFLVFFLVAIGAV
jgi:hypothetical protein